MNHVASTLRHCCALHVKGAVKQFLAAAALAAPMVSPLVAAMAQDSRPTDYLEFLKWVEAVVPKDFGSGPLPARRKIPVGMVFEMRKESTETNRSVLNLWSEFGSALAYASGPGLRSGGVNRGNLILIVGEGYVDNGRLTDKFFSTHKFAPRTEAILRESSGWSECYTYAFFADHETIDATITVMDDRLDQPGKRTCALVAMVNAFGFLVDPAQEQDIDAFHPRYITLAAARNKCSGAKDYAGLTWCIMNEFAIQK